MIKQKPRKKVALRKCSECHKHFNIDDLKIHWGKVYRLVCKKCFEAITKKNKSK